MISSNNISQTAFTWQDDIIQTIFLKQHLPGKMTAFKRYFSNSIYLAR